MYGADAGQVLRSLRPAVARRRPRRLVQPQRAAVVAEADPLAQDVGRRGGRERLGGRASARSTPRSAGRPARPASAGASPPRRGSGTGRACGATAGRAASRSYHASSACSVPRQMVDSRPRTIQVDRAAAEDQVVLEVRLDASTEGSSGRCRSSCCSWESPRRRRSRLSRHRARTRQPVRVGHGGASPTTTRRHDRLALRRRQRRFLHGLHRGPLHRLAARPRSASPASTSGARREPSSTSRSRAAPASRQLPGLRQLLARRDQLHRPGRGRRLLRQAQRHPRPPGRPRSSTRPAGRRRRGRRTRSTSTGSAWPCPPTASAQGLAAATAQFTWEARNQ